MARRPISEDGALSADKVDLIIKGSPGREGTPNSTGNWTTAPGRFSTLTGPWMTRAAIVYWECVRATLPADIPCQRRVESDPPPPV
jgi:hypothetical protein